MAKSLRQQVFDYLDGDPKITVKKLRKVFPEANMDTIKRYMMIYRKEHKYDRSKVNIKEELVKIIKDYRTPASARVQAIREYNNMIKNMPEQTEEEVDTLLSLYNKVEGEDNGEL